MIYYPLSVLMLAGIKDILIISTPEDLPSFKRSLGSGEGVRYQSQLCRTAKPRWPGSGILIGEEFLAGEPSCLVLGDNIYFGQGFSPKLKVLQRALPVRLCSVIR